MCARYHFSAEEAAEIRKIIHEVQDKIYGPPIKTGEIYPTNFVPVLVAGGDAPEAAAMYWGFPHFKGNGVIINARAETVTEKKMFRDSIISRRCVIPSTGFFEWKKEEDGSKTKLLFREPGCNVLYMAGFWNQFKNRDGRPEQRFIILTTVANESMKDTEASLSLFPEDNGKMIHDRMPVILRPEEREAWLKDQVDFDSIFSRKSTVLEHWSA